MASADPIDDDVDDALRQDSSRRDRASPDPAGAEQEKSGRYPPAARSVDESVRKNATNSLNNLLSLLCIGLVTSTDSNFLASTAECIFIISCIA